MNDNFRLLSPKGMNNDRLLCEREFVDLMKRLRTSGCSWNALASGLQAAQDELDTALDDLGAKLSEQARRRRAAKLDLGA